MTREEPRTGRIAEFEFHFWECWESDDNVPEALKRHWFRSDTGLEAPTYDHMLQMLYRQKMGLPLLPQMASEPQRSCTSEWDKRTCVMVRVKGEEIPIHICEHYSEESGGAPVSTKVIGPNGLVTSSYPEMLERLGIGAENQQSAISSQHSAQARGRHSGAGLPRAEQSRVSEDIDVLSNIGKSVRDAMPQQVASVTELPGGDAASAAPQHEMPSLSRGRRQRYIRVGDCDVEVTEYEYVSPGDSNLILSRKFVAPDGTETSTYREMLEKLGGRPRPFLPEDEHRPASTGSQATQNLTKECVPEMELREQGSDAVDATAANGNKEQVDVRSPQVSEAQPPGLKRRIRITDHPLFPNEFSTEGRSAAENAMETVWFAEWLRELNPDLYEAALDSVKRKQYLERKAAEERIAADTAPRCQFIKADGERCGSPALKKRRFCYFHNQTRAERTQAQEFELPVLEDDLAIQMAVTNVCRGLLKKSLEPKHATALLYGLQVASAAVRKAAAAKSKTLGAKSKT